MTKSELISLLSGRYTQLVAKDTELAVKTILDAMSHSLVAGERIEIRGFGSFGLNHRPPRLGRNPKTGDEVPIAPRRVLVFRPSHVLKAVINGQTPSPEGEG